MQRRRKRSRSRRAGESRSENLYDDSVLWKRSPASNETRRPADARRHGRARARTSRRAAHLVVAGGDEKLRTSKLPSSSLLMRSIKLLFDAAVTPARSSVRGSRVARSNRCRDRAVPGAQRGGEKTQQVSASRARSSDVRAPISMASIRRSTCRVFDAGPVRSSRRRRRVPKGPETIRPRPATTRETLRQISIGCSTNPLAARNASAISSRVLTALPLPNSRKSIRRVEQANDLPPRLEQNLGLGVRQIVTPANA